LKKPDFSFNKIVASIKYLRISLWTVLVFWKIPEYHGAVRRPIRRRSPSIPRNQTNEINIR